MEGTMSEIRLFGGNFAPKNWLTCDGQLLAIATNQALFSLLGTTFGGDGRNTFALPDLRGRVAVGISNSLTPLGMVIGKPTVTLAITQLPSHNHATPTPFTSANPIKVSSSNSDLSSPVAGTALGVMGTAEGRGGFSAVFAYSAATVVPDVTLNATTFQLSPIAEGQSGGSQPHNNMQPWTGVPHVICLYGIYPSRN